MARFQTARSTSSLGAARQTTYRAVKPLGTHFRKATCAEVDCPNYLNGWKTILPKSNQNLIQTVKNMNLRYTEEDKGDMVEFIFEAGQTCFKRNEHYLDLGRPAIVGYDDGLGFRKQETDQWVDKFNNHLTKLKGEIENG